jgi:hypothetical protein
MFPPRVTWLGNHHVGQPEPALHTYDPEMGLTTEDDSEAWPHETSSDAGPSLGEPRPH